MGFFIEKQYFLLTLSKHFGIKKLKNAIFLSYEMNFHVDEFVEGLGWNTPVRLCLLVRYRTCNRYRPCEQCPRGQGYGSGSFF